MLHISLQLDDNYLIIVFQWAPTLGGECYFQQIHRPADGELVTGFNGHPPLGVNATAPDAPAHGRAGARKFQWAPTLGGECYGAALPKNRTNPARPVSMGTHPWG